MLGYDGLPCNSPGKCDASFFKIKRTNYYVWILGSDEIWYPRFYLPTEEALDYLKCSRMSLWRNLKAAETDYVKELGFKYPRLYSDKSLVDYKQKLDAQKAAQPIPKQK